MSYAFYFKKLRKLTLKQISTEHHVSNLRAYIANNILQLKVRFLYKISNNITIPGLGPSYDTSIDVLNLRQILRHVLS
jgi:hypothetical protein